MKYKALIATTLIAASVQADEVNDPLPAGWFEAGPAQGRETCKVGADADLKAQGSFNISIKCEGKGNGFASVMQIFSGENYRGKRIRFSAEVKTENVGDSAGLWMRVDNAGKDNASFDNMNNRSLKGTLDWSRYSVVLDASEDAADINYGVLMNNSKPGQVWIRNLQFEVVGPEVAVTDMLVNQQQSLSKTPINIELK